MAKEVIKKVISTPIYLLRVFRVDESSYVLKSTEKPFLFFFLKATDFIDLKNFTRTVAVLPKKEPNGII
jgi:hypothetical protein